jgi:putative hydrolase of the HAD superfamily
MIKFVCFDLDNTLYDQKLYFIESFNIIAKYLNESYSISYVAIIDKLWSLLNSKGSMYPRLFDDLLNLFGLYDKKIIKDLVQLFHQAPVTSLMLYEDARNVLPLLAQKYMLGLITNGDQQMQKRKVAALGLEELLNIKIYTAEIGFPKPAPEGYNLALKMAEIGPEKSLYVGDNPYIDFEGANNIGFYTVRLLRGEFKDSIVNDSLVDATIQDFYELQEFLFHLTSESSDR